MSIIINQHIASQLEALGKSLSGQSGQQYRARAYFNAAEAIRKHPEAISSGAQAKLDIKGVGKTTAERIDEFLASGSVMLSSRDEARTPDFDKASVITMFTRIHGVGPVTAEKWYQAGHRSLDDLASLYPSMTQAQQLGYKYYLQLKIRIPRSEIELMKQLFEQSIIDHEFLICGSYRRGHRTSGDVDLLVKGKGGEEDNYILSIIVSQLMKQNFIVGTLAHKNKKFMGIVSLSVRHNARRLDIMVTPPENWAAAMLYFTGSKTLNVQMREAAQLKDMRLNEYGLWKVGADGSTDMKDMKLLETNTEEHIFDYLGLDYLEPADRDL